jgi:hypothetical protein
MTSRSAGCNPDPAASPDPLGEHPLKSRERGGQLQGILRREADKRHRGRARSNEGDRASTAPTLAFARRPRG